jgi:hypothetical protein
MAKAKPLRKSQPVPAQATEKYIHVLVGNTAEDAIKESKRDIVLLAYTDGHEEYEGFIGVFEQLAL